MSYRPHKRKKATNLEGKCLERIVKDFHEIFRPGVLSVALRTKVLELLCDNPVLVSLPEGEISPLTGALQDDACPAQILARTIFSAQGPGDHLIVKYVTHSATLSRVSR
jgi:hypothetical protein